MSTAMRADDHAVWEATHRLGLHRLTDAELEALMRRTDSPQPEAHLVAEAAHYVRHLRLGLAKGDGF